MPVYELTKMQKKQCAMPRSMQGFVSRAGDPSIHPSDQVTTQALTTEHLSCMSYDIKTQDDKCH